MDCCVSCKKYCKGVNLDPEHGIVPRAFSFGDGSIADKHLAIVFGEPGASRWGLHRKYRTAQSTRELSEIVSSSTRKCFETHKSPFHQRTMKLLEEVFGSDVFLHCYFTNLTKCEKFGGSIPIATRRMCMQTFLIPELRMIRPRCILLFGNNAIRFAEILAEIAPVIRADHPSARPPAWLGQPEREKLLARIRDCLI